MKNENKILGISLIAFGIYLSIDSAQLYYYYNYTNLIFYFMHPNYELIARFILGLSFIPTGVLILLKTHNRFKILYRISSLMIIYGILRFIINFEDWSEEFFTGFIYIVTGLIFIGLVKKNKF